MKFGKYLESHLLPIWRHKYVDYRILKKLIKKKDLLEDVDEFSPLISPYVKKNELFQNQIISIPNNASAYERKFLSILQKELLKVQCHYKDKYNQIQTTCNELFESLNDLECGQYKKPTRFSPWESLSEHQTVEDDRHMFSVDQLKQGYREIHRQLHFLKDFQKLNATAVLKILKKYDKANDFKIKDRVMVELKKSDFPDKATDVENLIEEVEDIFARAFHEGNKKAALKKLEQSKMSVPQRGNRWRAFRLGLYFGITLAIIIHIFETSIISLKSGYDYDYLLYPLFRSVAYPLLLAFFCAINMYVWKRTNINHSHVFEIERISGASSFDVLEMVGVFSVLWSISLLTYRTKRMSGVEVAQYVPLILFAVIVIMLINPFNVFFRRSRFWLLKIAGRAFLAPFVAVNFADFWLADQMVSLGPMFVDFEYMFCHYVTNWSAVDIGTNGDVEYNCSSPIRISRLVVSILPAWIRLAQCLRRFYDTRCAYPHLVNSGKYLMTILVTVVWSFYSAQQGGAIHDFLIFFLISSVVQTLYSFAYDIFLDWGLKKRHKINSDMSPSLLYSAPVYMTATVLNAVLRSVWILKLFHLGIPNFWSQSLMGFLEIVRRFGWNFLRIEHEYVNDCLVFHSVLSQDLAEFAQNEETYAFSRHHNSFHQTSNNPEASKFTQSIDIIEPVTSSSDSISKLKRAYTTA